MGDSMYMRPLKPLDLTEMYITFLDAFSDYPVPFKLTKEQFVRKFVQKLKLDFNLSVGAFHYDGSLAGFILTSTNYYEGRNTAYNGGTGVRPRYRGQQLTLKMYDYLIPLLKNARIKQCVLEVLTSNERAIKSYERVGFEKSRYFKCYALKSKTKIPQTTNSDIEIFNVKIPNWDLYERFSDFRTSFLDSTRMIIDNLANETIIEARLKDECIGFGIYQPSFGRISQIGVAPDHRRKGIGTAIMHYIWDTSLHKKLTVINVDKQAENIMGYLDSMHFDNQLDQYEMTLTL